MSDPAGIDLKYLSLFANYATGSENDNIGKSNPPPPEKLLNFPFILTEPTKAKQHKCMPDRIWGWIIIRFGPFTFLRLAPSFIKTIISNNIL